MTPKDAIGITCATTGLILLTLGRPILGLRGQLCGLALLAIGILRIYLAKRKRQIDADTLDDLSASSDGDYLLGSHDLADAD